MSVPQRDAVEVLVLDLDDTILDDRSGGEPAWREAAQLLHRQDPELDLESLLGAIRAQADWFWSDAGRHRSGRLDLVAARRTIVQRALEALGRPGGAVAELAVRRYDEVRESRFALLDGAEAAVTRLRDEFRHLALLTNGASVPQRAKIERFGLERFFDHIQVEGEVGCGKPEARAFHRVAAAFGAPPERCLMVGDDFGRDVLGALDAGLHAVWIDRQGRGAPPERPPRPHGTALSLAALVDPLLAS